MGILNVTPDSFSDGGRFVAIDEAWKQAQRLVVQGAQMIDVGAESSRPGATPLTAEHEIVRLAPWMQRWSQRPLAAWLSVDTRHTETARWALSLGAQIINDISGSPSPALIDAILEADATYVLMHNAENFSQMHRHHTYDNVVEAVETTLRRQVQELQRRGLRSERIWIDPGLGFAKDVADSWRLVEHTQRLAAIGVPLLIGPSRKRFLKAAGEKAKKSAARWRELDRKTAAVCAILASRGARIFRVHNPAACREALYVGHQVAAVAGSSPH